jgi:hypothetical protein
MAFKTLIGTTP